MRRQEEHAVRDVRDALYVARNTDGKLVRRPMSPHLQIYRWPVAMAVSISHRVTGVGLGIGTLLLTWWLVAAATSNAAFERVQWFLGTPVGMFVLFCWTLSLLLHWFSGIRHLIWDMGYGFDAPVYRPASWAVFIGAGVLTLLVWAIGLAYW
jgi:succinate dehydrogenase / fumarate reductase cytochrome b subunit